MSVQGAEHDEDGGVEFNKPFDNLVKTKVKTSPRQVREVP
jgi:hypothetical protein